MPNVVKITNLQYVSTNERLDESHGHQTTMFLRVNIIYLFIYSFSDSWIRGYVPETEIQGTMTFQFPRKSQPLPFYRRDAAN